MIQDSSVLQWNMGCSHARNAAPVATQIEQDRCELIEAMIEEHNPTFVALQETPHECPDRLREKLARRYEVIKGQSGLITLYSIDWSESHFAHEQRASMLLLKHRDESINVQIRLWNVHFWSNYKTDSKEIASKVRKFVNDHVRQHRLESISKTSKKTSEIIVGDFNICPYAETVAGRDCLWANQSLQWALTRARSAGRDPDKRYQPLFNPSWELLGHHEPPFGTYYYDKRPDVDGPWYVFDQMLMSPVHGLTNQRHTMLLSKVGKKELWSDNKSRRPDAQLGSDHYPVLVKFKLS
jgi:exonuclease III